MEIVSGVHRIEAFRCNSYVIEGEKLTVVDTGFPGQAGKIAAYIKSRLGRKPEDIGVIILTHCDFDHTGGVRELVKESGAIVAAHRIEADYLALRKKRLGPPGSGWNVNFTYDAIAGLMKLTRRLPIAVDLPLEERDVISGLRVYHTPGHTAGSIVLHDEIRKILFSGDSLVYDNGVLHSSPRHLTMCPADVAASMAKIKALDFDVMLDGHGPPFMPRASARIRALGVG